MKKLLSAALFCLFWTASAQAQAPSAPALLKGSTISATRIDLRWADNSLDETSFRVERCSGANCTSYAEINSTAANVTAYSDTAVSANTTYSYRVRARNGSGDSAYANVFQHIVTPASGTLTTLRAWPENDILIVNRYKTFTLAAYDAASAQMKYIHPLCVSSNTGVVQVVPRYGHTQGVPWGAGNIALDDGRVQTYLGVAAGAATVTCSLGGVSDVMTVKVIDPAATPSVSIGGDVSGGAASVKTLQPLEIDLENSAGVASVRIQWGDGDETRGDYSAALSAVHSYRTAGTKTLTVTVTNSAGTPAQATATVTVADLVCSSTLTATSLSDLLTKYNAATGGECIRLAPGAYTGQLILPAKTWTTGDGWVTLMSSGTMPAVEKRVSPTADSAQLVRVNSDLGTVAAIELQDGVNHVRMIGFRAEMASGVEGDTLWKIGSGANTSQSQQPNNIIIQHGVISNPSEGDCKHGFMPAGYKIAAISSSFTGIQFIGRESHAVWTSNGRGAFVFYNTEMEGAGMPLLTGGSRTFAEGEVQKNWEFRRCYFFKRLAWRSTTNRSMKNLFETKTGQRIYVGESQLSNSYAPAGQFYAIVLKTLNQGDDSPWIVSEDIVFENVRVYHAVGGINTLWDLYDNAVCRAPANIQFKNVLFEDVSGATWGDVAYGGNYGKAHGWLVGYGLFVSLDHVTMLTPDGNFIHNAGYDARGLTVKNSVVGMGHEGIRSDDYTQGSATLLALGNGEYTFTKNVAIAYGPSITGLSTNYPSYNVDNKYPTTVAGAKFVDYAGGDYRLASDSPGKNFATDSTDSGVNFTALQTALGASGLPLASASIKVETGDWTGGGGAASPSVKARGKVKLRGRLKINP